MKRLCPDDPQPDFMVLLGLAPPYRVEDVKQAYLEKAKRAHPDRGGSAEEFTRLQEAFERATEYARFRAGRLKWLGAQMDRYAQQEQVIAQVRQWGGQTEIQRIEWLHCWCGQDFAQVADRLIGIGLRGVAQGDRALAHLARHREALADLHWLDLAESGVTDGGLLGLCELPRLKRLDLAATSITGRGLKLLERLPALEWLNLAGTRVSWLGRWKLRRRSKNLEIVTSAC